MQRVYLRCTFYVPIPAAVRLHHSTTVTAAAAVNAAAATATAAATHGGELRGAFLDELSDVLAVNGREESAQLSVVNFRGDCEVERNERTRLSATGRVMVRATRGRY